jgi:hypothetical protein
VNSHRNRDWYHEGDVARTLRAVKDKGSVYTENVVDVLAAREFDAPRERVRNLVENTMGSLPDKRVGETQQPALESPRPKQSSVVTLADLEYLGRRDMAILLGAVLSRFQGSFRTPADVDNVAADLFWNRQQTTAALRVVPYSNGTKIDRPGVESFATGNTNPASGRAPSTHGIISLTGFTEAARAAGDEFDISLFGRGHIRRWLSQSQLTDQILGALLEEGPHSTEEIDEQLAALPAMPDVIQNQDPFDITPVEGGSVDELPESMPVSDEPAQPGQTGTLYADPSEDGDFDSFDRVVSDLKSESEDHL